MPRIFANLARMVLALGIAAVAFFLVRGCKTNPPASTKPLVKVTKHAKGLDPNLVRNQWLAVLDQKYQLARLPISQCLQNETLSQSEIAIRTQWDSVGRMTQITFEPTLSKDGRQCVTQIISHWKVPTPADFRGVSHLKRLVIRAP